MVCYNNRQIFYNFVSEKFCNENALYVSESEERQQNETLCLQTDEHKKGIYSVHIGHKWPKERNALSCLPKYGGAEAIQENTSH